MVYIIMLCITVPMLLMLPVLEKRSRYLVGFFLLGVVVAVSAYEVNTMLYPLVGLVPRSFTHVVPPMVEEVLKAIPVFIFAIFLTEDRKQVLPIAMSVGVGFAVLENTMILIQNIDTVTLSWAATRGISASLMHGLCTMIIGAGLPYLKKHKKLFYTGVFGLWAIAVTMHGIFNLLIQSEYKTLGALLPMAVYLGIYLLKRSGRIKLPFLSY